jgi:tetratricopeptide (TPR) repeat protein
MRMIRAVGLLMSVGAVASTAVAAEAGRKFAWSTGSEEAKQLLTELQDRIESMQFGPENQEIAEKIVAADPSFAMGHYYLSATSPGQAGVDAYEKSRELAKNASEGERQFIEALSHVRANQGANFRDSIPPLEKLAKEYTDERLVFVILGQLYSGAGEGDKARVAFERAKEIGPPSLRVESFLAGDELLQGNYAQAREAFAAIEAQLPEGSVPFTIRFGTTFSHLYEGQTDAAIASLTRYLEQYRASGSSQQFPDVFIHNAIARINLESGRLEEAMRAYQAGYESVPDSDLPEDQKQTWLGRLHHGRCRVLAKMGEHEKAWSEAEVVRQMIEEGGEAAEQFWPAYHYLAGYVLLEAGKYAEAVEHLEQANQQDPFHKLLLARAHEKLGHQSEAEAIYSQIVESKWTGIERALAFPEAKRKLES